jgi:hypothetical protein
MKQALSSTRLRRRENEMAIKRVDNIDQRFYEVDDLKLPSVTSILKVISKPALVPWASKMAVQRYTQLLRANEVGDFGQLMAIERSALDAFEEEAKGAHRDVMQSAADVGTRVHEYLEALYTESPLPEITAEMAIPLQAYDEWVATSKLNVLDSERMVYSKQYGYAGTLDVLGTMGDDVVVADWKTSSGVWDEYALQLAAYANAVVEMGLVARVDKALVIRFDKQGRGKGFEVKEVKDLGRAFDGFLAALNLSTIMGEKHF